MEERQIIVNNLLINYLYWPATKVAKGTLVFLHGWRCSSKIWLPVIELIQGEDYQIYSLDFPGFGKSEIPEVSLKVEDYALLVRDFILNLRLQNVCLIGHSFGGRIVIKLAANFPETVQTLILVSSAGPRPKSYSRLIISFFAKVLKPAFALPFLRTLRPRIYHMLGAEDYLALPGLRASFLNIINEDLTSLLSQIRQPTLIIWGEDDKEVPLRFGKIMNDLVRHSKLVILDEVGHFSFLEKTEEFVKILKDFLNDSSFQNN